MTKTRTLWMVAAVAATSAACLAPAAHAAGSWSAPQTLTAAASVGNGGDIATGGDGSAAVVYAAGADSATKQVMVSVREAGASATASAPAGFGAPQAISDPVSQLYGASAFVDDSGNATVAWWAQRVGGDAAVWVRSKPAGSPWGPTQLIGEQPFSWNAQNVFPELVGTPGGRQALLVGADGAHLYDRAPGAAQFSAVAGTDEIRHIAMNDGGDLAAVYQLADDESTASDPVEVRVRPVGGSFGPAHRLGVVSTWLPRELDRLAIALTANGTVVAAFNQYDDNLVGTPDAPPTGLFVAVRTPGATFGTGTWSAAERVNVGTAFADAYHPVARVESASKVSISWSEYAENDLDEISRERMFPSSATSKIVDGWVASASSPATGRAIGLPLSRALWGGPPPPVPTSLRAVVRPSLDAAYEPAVTAVPESSEVSRFRAMAVALDEQGNGYLSWNGELADGSGKSKVGISAYDPVAPTLSSVSVPAEATTGSPVAVSAKATDRISKPTFSWSFGDGATATGASPSHTYAAPGTFTVKVTATDAAGNATSTTKSITVKAAQLPKVDARPALWTPSYAGGKTLIRALELANLKAGDTVKTRCDGPGCTIDGFKTVTVSTATPRLLIALGANGIRLSTGATFKVVISRPGALAQTAKFTMNAGRYPTRQIWY